MSRFYIVSSSGSSRRSYSKQWKWNPDRTWTGTYSFVDSFIGLEWIECIVSDSALRLVLCDAVLLYRAVLLLGLRWLTLTTVSVYVQSRLGATELLPALATISMAS